MTYTRPEPGKPILIEIADQMLELRFTLRALKALDTEAHISVLRGDGLGDAMRDPEKMATVLFYGLKTKNPDVTLEWVEDNVDASMLMDLAPMLVLACTGRWVEIERVLEAVPNVARPTGSTGSLSGPLAGTTSGALNVNSGA